MVLLRLATLRLVVLVLAVEIAVAVPQQWDAAAGFATELVLGTRSRLAVDVLVRLVAAVVLVVARPDRRNALFIFALKLQHNHG
jgi:hypothetical protein